MKMALEMIAVADAISSSYDEINKLGRELRAWETSQWASLRTDNRDRTYHLRVLSQDLLAIVKPDVSRLGVARLSHQICANLLVTVTSREARKQNALSKLRPVAASFLKTGLSELAKKIEKDIWSVDGRPIPGAFERGL